MAKQTSHNLNLNNAENAATNPVANLTSLPVEILLNILNRLQLGEKIMLSQTSKALRSKLQKEGDRLLRATNPVERYQTVKVLSIMFPEHYICISCRFMHPVDPRDLPHGEFDPHFPISWLSTRRWEPLWTRVLLHAGYDLSYRHVQLALKYNRLKDYQQEYLSALLQTYQIVEQLGPLELKFQAEPKINGEEFLLKTTQSITNPAHPLDYAMIEREVNVWFCPHRKCGMGAFPLDPLVSAVMKVIENPQHQGPDKGTALSCELCPTDYSVSSVGENSVTICAYYNFGTEAPYENANWGTHLYTSSPAAQSIFDWANDIYLPAMEQRLLGPGYHFDYQPGSIKEMFDASEESTTH